LVTTARFTSLLNCALAVGEMVDKAIRLCNAPHAISPKTGAWAPLIRLKKRGNRRWSADILAVCARVNCQPSSEPIHATTASAMMMSPTNGVKICAYTRANGAEDSASSALGTMPWITLVDSTYTSAAPRVPSRQASGTVRLGSSTAS